MAWLAISLIEIVHAPFLGWHGSGSSTKVSVMVTMIFVKFLFCLFPSFLNVCFIVKIATPVGLKSYLSAIKKLDILSEYLQKMAMLFLQISYF